MASVPPKIPPLPQRNPIATKDGSLTLTWNMFFVELLRYIQANTNAINAMALTSGTGGAGTLPTGTGVALTELPSAEGTQNLYSRADHTHQIAIQSEDDGVDFGLVQAINAEGPILESKVEPNLTGSLLTDLYGYWPFDEESGTRACVLGSGPDLTESGGTVPSDDGRFGNAITGDESDTFDLRTISASVPMSGGITLAFWFYWPAFSSAFPKSMLSFDDAGDAFFQVGRFYNSNFIEIGFYWGLGVGENAFLPTPRLGPFAIDTWHLLVIDYDPVTGVLRGRVDDGCKRDRFPYAGQVDALNPCDRLSTTVPGASLTAANAVTFTIISFMKAFSANFKNFEGRIDAPMIWTRQLTDAEVALLWTSFRKTLSVNPMALETFGGL